VTDKLLLADDDSAFREVYRALFEGEGYEVIEAGTGPLALAAFAKSTPRLVVLDLMLPPSGRPEEGAEACAKMLALRPDAKIIIASGAGDTELALRLVQRGAYDFLAKPIDPDVLLAVIARASARLALEDRVAELERTIAANAGTSNLLGSSAAFVEARTLAERAAPTDVPVLLTGASGTGKEVFARLVHDRSRRHDKAFVAVNCGAIAPTLLESALFGHKRGSFTGAVRDATGLFVEADGGTLFLDEIADLDVALQGKLLRALEAGEVLPVGASKPVNVDVRIISATHKPLAELIKEKSFRDDLYWRIRGIEVPLPRLAERAGDLAMLAQHFLNQARALVPRAPVTSISPAAMRRMEAYAWPGNLRELRHEMQRALVMAAGRPDILEEDLSPAIASPAGSEPVDTVLEGATLEEKITALERREITLALAATSGNRSHAAQRLGLSRQGLLNKMARYNIS
jgi:DNA-binding NtrC family response regulator